MSLQNLISALESSRLIASVQAQSGEAVDQPEILAALAIASLKQGVSVLRMQGVENIRAGMALNPEVMIGLIKLDFEGSSVYITPTSNEVSELIETGCQVIALDATRQVRPRGETLRELVSQIHAADKLAMGDIDSVESAKYALDCGVDILSTTLAGYTPSRVMTEGPDFDVLRQVVEISDRPVFAEGRFAQRWQIETALRIGAAGVVVGGTLNDPFKTTRALMPRKLPKGNVGAVDIGGTWLRFGCFNPSWELETIEKIPNPKNRRVLIEWVKEQIEAFGVEQIGVSTGGIVDYRTGEVWTAKEYLMPDHIGVVFSEETLGVKTHAFGDGHATAWAHACRPEYAGLRVATLALGTGVGCGFVEDGRIWAGRKGEYPRVNDLPTLVGKTYEELLGGIHLSPLPTDEQKEMAVLALEGAVRAVRDFYFPDVLVLAGSVGLCDWIRPHAQRLECDTSPFGHDAGLYGAAALSLFPPA